MKKLDKFYSSAEDEKQRNCKFMHACLIFQLFLVFAKYLMEIFLTAILFVCVINFFIGKRTNKNLAVSWMRLNKQYFE